VLTATTTGMAAPVGGFLVGAGASLISKPIRKDISEEHLEFEDSVSEALVYGAVGSVVTTVGCAALVPEVATQIPMTCKFAAASTTGAFLLSERCKYNYTVDLRSNIWSIESIES